MMKTFSVWIRKRTGLELLFWGGAAFVCSAFLMMFLLGCVSSSCCPESVSAATPVVASDSTGLESFVVVTAASHKFFDRLKNFIGSMHFWEPGQKIVIFDLGLSQEQILEALCWENVALRPFLFDKYPLHVRNVYNYAWKILLIDEIANEYSTILVLDAGVEIRRPLTPIKEILRSQKYFIATQSNVVLKKTHADTFLRLGVSRSSNVFQNRPFCSGGIQGYDVRSVEFQTIRKRLVKCALDETCIAPIGSARSNHNYDQSALSIVVYDEGYRCEGNRDYFEGDMAYATLNEREKNHVVLALRRWKIPRPYVQYLVQRPPICPTSVPYNITSDGIIETTQSFRIDTKSELQECLRKHQNDRQLCASYIQKARKIPAIDSSVRTDQLLHHSYVIIRKALWCPRVYMGTPLIFATLLVLRYKSTVNWRPRKSKYGN